MNKINIIAAIGKDNRVIGNSLGQIPWHISKDFQYFKKTTTGFPIIMGRKTFESLGGKILPNRHHVIITRQRDYSLPKNLLGNKNVSIVSNIKEATALALKIASDLKLENIFIIGGGEIYKQSLDIADYLYLTLVERKDGQKISGDVFFPEYENLFSKIISTYKSFDDKYNFEFIVLGK